MMKNIFQNLHAFQLGTVYSRFVTVCALQSFTSVNRSCVYIVAKHGEIFSQTLNVFVEQLLVIH